MSPHFIDPFYLIMNTLSCLADLFLIMNFVLMASQHLEQAARMLMANSSLFYCFSSMLKPQPPSKPSIELLAQAPTMDNNRLEKLVKNFVVEDKARLAAKKNMASSIQYALQKFEKNSQPDVGLVKRIPAKTNNTSHAPVNNSNNTSPTLKVSAC